MALCASLECKSSIAIRERTLHLSVHTRATMADATPVAAADAVAVQEARKLKHAEKERLEVEKLEQRIAEQTPARGSQLEEAANFEFFPLSDATKRGACVTVAQMYTMAFVLCASILTYCCACM